MTRISSVILTALMTLIISGCNNSTAESTKDVVRIESDDPAIETVRIVNVLDTNTCQLTVKKGREDPEIFSPKTCTITRKDGFAVEIAVSFDAPCRQYRFKNLIGDKYFLDEKTLGTRVAEADSPQKVTELQSFFH